jgi:hypothetical protein
VNRQRSIGFRTPEVGERRKWGGEISYSNSFSVGKADMIEKIASLILTQQKCNFRFGILIMRRAGNLILLLILSLCFFSSNAQLLSEQWARTAGGTVTDTATAVAVDNQGGVYIAGSFKSSSFAIGNITLTNAGGSDIFIAKYDTAGNFLWAKRFGGSGNESVRRMALSVDGSLYLTDTFSASITIGDSTLTSVGQVDVYVAKFDNTGQLQWTRRIGGNLTETNPDIITDAHGAVYIGGGFSSYSITIDTEIISNGYGGSKEDCFLAKYSANGSFSYLKKIVSNYFVGSIRPVLSLGRDENIYYCYFYGGSSGGSYRTWFDSTGSQLGNQQLSTNLRYYTYGYAAKNVNEYYYVGLYVMLSGYQDLEIGAPGNYSWIEAYGCSDKNPVNTDFDNLGNRFFAGRVSNSSASSCSPISPLSFGGAYNLPYRTGSDIYIIRTDDAGYLKDLYSTRDNGGTNEYSSRMAMDTTDHSIYVAGSWSKIADTSKFYFGNSVLTNAGNAGISDVLLLKFKYSLFSLAANAGTDKTICYGGSTTIGNNATGGNGSYTYNWVPASGLSSSSVAVPTAHPTVTTDYVLTVTDGLGTIVRDTVRVNVDSNLYRPTITESAGVNPFCQGAFLNLTSSPAVSYSWSTGSTSQTINVTSSATLTVTAVRNDGCIGTSLSYNAIMTPRTATPATTPANAASICQGSSITLTAQDAESPVSYQWSTGATTPSITVSSAGNYSVNAIGPNGCPSLPASVVISVNPLPTVNSISNRILCHGDAGAAINFSGAVTPTVYTWTSTANIGFGTSGTGNIAAYTATNSTSSPITATVTVTPSANGCTGSPTNFTVTVNPSPTVNSVSNRTHCNGDAGVAINFNGSVGLTTYTWTSTANVGFGTNSVGNISAYTATNTTSSPITATVTVTPTANGCTGTATTFTVTINPTPTVNSVSNRTHCNEDAGPAINFNGAVSSTTYTWASTANIGFGTSGTGNISAYTATNTTSSPITATVTVTPTANGCTGTAITFTVTVNPKPVASITQAANILTALPNAMSYQWYLDGSAINGATNQTVTITTGGSYSVRVADNNGCSDTATHDAILRIVTPGLTYQVYPNPVLSDLKLIYTLTKQESVSIRIQSFDGRDLFIIVKNEVQQAGEHGYTVANISKKLQRGFYFVQFIISGKTTTHKILIL